MDKSGRIYPKAPFSASARWWVLLASFFMMFFLVALAMGVVKAAVSSQYAVILISSTLQGLIAFAFPAWIAWRLTSEHPAADMGLATPPAVKAIIGVVVTYILAYPALNQIIYWNSIITFPAPLHSLETTLRAWEDSSNEMSTILLSADTWWALQLNILVVGIITGFSEETLFRGGLQRMMCASGLKATYAIWIGAFIFSAIHFQFFGFIPRLLLGAWFGYLLVWTRSLWTAAFAHALNNTVVIVGAWIAARYFPGANPDEIGVAYNSIPWAALFSAIATFLFIWRFHKYVFSPGK